MNILLVDDDDSIRVLARFLLEVVFKDTKIDEAGNVREALALLEQNKYSLVLSDYNMPDGVGTELERYIKARHPHVRFVLSSSAPPEGYCGNLLRKPYTIDEFKSAFSKI